MNDTYWGFNHSPFQGTPAEPFFYCGQVQEEALARIRFLMENQRYLGLMLGPPGSGKTSLLHAFARDARKNGDRVVMMDLSRLTPDGLIWHLAQHIGIRLDCTTTPFGAWRALVDRLAEYGYQRSPTVLLLDNADEAGQALLGHVVRLLQFEPAVHSPLTMLLTASTNRFRHIGRRLLDISELRIELETWSVAETAECLQMALQSAGVARALFDDAAAMRLHILSGGLASSTRRLAEATLGLGARKQLSHIDVATVDAAYRQICADSCVGILAGMAAA